jgi:hypothetical protein
MEMLLQAAASEIAFLKKQNARIEAARRSSSTAEEDVRIIMLGLEFGLEPNSRELKYITSQTFYLEVCWDIGPWVARVLQVPDRGKLKVQCNQKDVPFSADLVQVKCDDTTLISSERPFSFPDPKNQHRSYFDVSYRICQTSTSILAAFESDSESDEDRPPPSSVTVDCGGHGCAGYFQGNNATIFDGADWLGKSPKVCDLLETEFKKNGFTLRIINKVYQTVLGNCAMFSAVCVFLMLVHGEDMFFGYMDKVSDLEKNRSIESTAIKIREKAVPLPFNLTLFFYNGSTTKISCDENAKTRTSRDALKKKAMRIIVPAEVTTIAQYAFHWCTLLTAITLPEGIRMIEDFAFSECHSLAAITLPKGVRMIGKSVFLGCNSLAAITLPKRITTIEPYTFSECTSLAAITLPERITTIGQYAFHKCTSLVSITLPKGMTTIEDGAFEECKSLVSVTIPKTVRKIGEDAFRESNLAAITLPEGLTTIDPGAFYYCSGLASINIPEGVKTIEAGTFYKCSKLNSVSLPSTLEKIIGDLEDDEPLGAFQECTLLSSITLPKGMTTIGNFAFYDCKTLASIIIPKGVTEIGEEAFRGCTSLSSIILPEGVTKIGARAFAGCTGLESIIFPSSVEVYGRDILAGCTSLQRIYCVAEDTERQADFFGVPRTVTTYHDFSYDQALRHDLAEVAASILEELDKDLLILDREGPVGRGVSRRRSEAFGKDSDSDSDSDSDDKPLVGRARTKVALYDWTRGER